MCSKCGKPYRTHITISHMKSNTYEYRRYVCSCARYRQRPFQGEPCHNKGWVADKLENLVWTQIERILANPSIIIAEIEKQRQGSSEVSVLKTELSRIEQRLKAIDREQEQLLDWALKGFPEDMIITRNKKLNSGRESLKVKKAELEARIKASQKDAITLPKLERFVELIKQKLSELDFETKRLAIEMLDIKVWIDGYNVEITGVIPIFETYFC